MYVYIASFLTILPHIATFLTIVCTYLTRVQRSQNRQSFSSRDSFRSQQMLMGRPPGTIWHLGLNLLLNYVKSGT